MNIKEYIEEAKKAVDFSIHYGLPWISVFGKKMSIRAGYDIIENGVVPESVAIANGINNYVRVSYHHVAPMCSEFFVKVLDKDTQNVVE